MSEKYREMRTKVAGYRRKVLVLTAATVLLAVGLAVQARNLDPLLELLVKNGVITRVQAEAVQGQYDLQKKQKAEEQNRQVTDTVKAEVPKHPALPAALRNLHVGTLMYLSYQNGGKYTGVHDETTSYNQFVLKRGYLDVKDDVTPWFQARFTTDITRAGDGSVNTRIKYLYGKFHWKGNNYFTKPYVEFGQVHVPYQDFWEAINGYRMQDTMFLERNHLFNSADEGFVVGSDFGGEMSADYRKRVNKHYAGRYGSWQLGVYNGGGYHAAEKNQNKVMEARFTLRPFPGFIPGLQVGVLGINGKGNVSKAAGMELPDWKLVDWMLSFESERFTATAEYYDGEGNQGGSVVNPDGSARNQRGYSLFASGKISADKKFRLIGRYDYFDPDSDHVTPSTRDVQKRYIAGVAYNMYKGNMWLLDYERLAHDLSYIPDEDRVQLTLQVKF